ncbi:MAG: hypothetical protein JRM99_08385 [Nitrososphaerota archaeon]|nr:hypothetical protein [Nitrososphaerota archaeon]
MAEQREKDIGKVKVDGEDAVLHITDQSVMFEKGGRVSGFERSAIRMVKPDGDAMIIAYSIGNKVESIRVEPVSAVASLVASAASQALVQIQSADMDAVFEKLYRNIRKELEERLVKVQAEPERKSLRLTPEQEAKYSQVSRQMESLIKSRHGFNAPNVENSPISFWGLEKQPYELQLAVVKERHVRFLRMIVGPKAETNDITYSTDEVWPDDWPRILERFSLDGNQYTTQSFINFVNYLRKHWTISPGEKKPVLAQP